MGNILIAMGVFVWFMMTTLSFAFQNPSTEGFLKRLKRSIKFEFKSGAGLEFGVSSIKLISIFWIVAGLIINLIDDKYLVDVQQGIVLGVIFLVPTWLAAILMRKRRK